MRVLQYEIAKFVKIFIFIIQSSISRDTGKP